MHKFLIYLLLFSTSFGQLCAHHQELISYLCDTWYLSLYTDDSGMQSGMNSALDSRQSVLAASVLAASVLAASVLAASVLAASVLSASVLAASVLAAVCKLH